MTTLGDLELETFPREPAPGAVVIRMPATYCERSDIEELISSIGDIIRPIWPDAKVILLSPGFELETVDPETLRQLMEREA